MLDKLERKIGWIAFPSIIKYLAFFQLGVLGLTFINPGASQLLAFNWNLILQGEVWRLFTFIFSPMGTLSDSMGGINAFFAVFAALLMMTFSDGLEGQWGAFRTTLFFLFGWLTCLITSILLSSTGLGEIGFTRDGAVVTLSDALSPGLLFDAAILYAFATYFPRYQILLFFILPVQIAILAVVSGVMFLMFAMQGLPHFLYVCGCLANYLLVVIPMLKAGGSRKVRQAKVRKKEAVPDSFHTCEVCGKKDTDDPKEYFRITAEGEELCGGCLELRK